MGSRDGLDEVAKEEIPSLPCHELNLQLTHHAKLAYEQLERK
jgi:hypothetical protein